MGGIREKPLYGLLGIDQEANQFLCVDVFPDIGSIRED